MILSAAGGVYSLNVCVCVCVSTGWVTNGYQHEPSFLQLWPLGSEGALRGPPSWGLTSSSNEGARQPPPLCHSPSSSPEKETWWQKNPWASEPHSLTGWSGSILNPTVWGLSAPDLTQKCCFLYLLCNTDVTSPPLSCWFHWKPWQRWWNATVRWKSITWGSSGGTCIKATTTLTESIFKLSVSETLKQMIWFEIRKSSWQLLWIKNSVLHTVHHSYSPYLQHIYIKYNLENL